MRKRTGKCAAKRTNTKKQTEKAVKEKKSIVTSDTKIQTGKKTEEKERKLCGHVG